MTELNFVTFNIRCFGFDGDYFGKNKTESRIPFLKKLIDQNYADTDVFILQEIMNPLIVSKILPEGFKFYTYQHDFKRHMYIVLACKKELDFQDFTVLPNTALDTTRSRPAVYGKLVFNQEPLMDVLGVHLKSKYEHTDNRKHQCQVISKFIDTLPSDRPKIMGGDFNSHFKEKTKKLKDDIVYIEEIFENQLTLAAHNHPTYLAANEEIQLDHFLVRGAQVLDLQVYDLHSYSPDKAFKKFYNEISDHLPVKIKVKL